MINTAPSESLDEHVARAIKSVEGADRRLKLRKEKAQEDTEALKKRMMGGTAWILPLGLALKLADCYKKDPNDGTHRFVNSKLNDATVYCASRGIPGTVQTLLVPDQQWVGNPKAKEGEEKKISLPPWERIDGVEAVNPDAYWAILGDDDLRKMVWEAFPKPERNGHDAHHTNTIDKALPFLQERKGKKIVLRPGKTKRDRESGATARWEKNRQERRVQNQKHVKGSSAGSSDKKKGGGQKKGKKK